MCPFVTYKYSFYKWIYNREYIEFTSKCEALYLISRTYFIGNIYQLNRGLLHILPYFHLLFIHLKLRSGFEGLLYIPETKYYIKYKYLNISKYLFSRFVAVGFAIVSVYFVPALFPVIPPS